MIGQKRLLNEEFPQFVILIGKHKSGKKTLIKEKYKDVITGLTSMDDVRFVIKNSNQLTSERTYVFEKIGYKVQNALLKITEEPNEYTRIIVTGRHEIEFLPTLLSRATLYKMDNYTKEELKQATEKEEYLKYYNTIGLLEKATEEDIETAKRVAENIDTLAIANLFNISNHIDDFLLFSKPFKYHINNPEVIKIVTEYEYFYNKGYNFVLDGMFLKIREELE